MVVCNFIIIINQNVKIIRTCHWIDNIFVFGSYRGHWFPYLCWNEKYHFYQSCQSEVYFLLWNRVSIVSVIIAAISMWIMWACTYMHQMNPLIQPILMVRKGWECNTLIVHNVLFNNLFPLLFIPIVPKYKFIY